MEEEEGQGCHSAVRFSDVVSVVGKKNATRRAFVVKPIKYFFLKICSCCHIFLPPFPHVLIRPNAMFSNCHGDMAYTVLLLPPSTEQSSVPESQGLQSMSYLQVQSDIRSLTKHVSLGANYYDGHQDEGICQKLPHLKKGSVIRP